MLQDDEQFSGEASQSTASGDEVFGETRCLAEILRQAKKR